MNPFDLRGPQFLLFYALLAAATLIVLGVLRRRRELALAGHTAPQLHDPYAIAYLRGGKSELLRVAVVSLVDRGLLASAGDMVVTTQVGRETAARKSVERELLRFCEAPRQPAELFQSRVADVETREYDSLLARQKLMPDDDIVRERRLLFGGAAGVLLLFSLAKIAIALGRGRSNILFLVLLTLFVLWRAWRVAFPRLTSHGQQFIAQLQNLFESLKLRAPALRPGGANADLVLAAAVFGISVLPAGAFASTKKLFQKADSSGSGCGSSCGSSGCGGGGCGSGCGGCGG
jgi:uncharacterized protein (TIGR04222 family)